MLQRKKGLLLVVLMVGMFAFSGCSVGTNKLFVSPSEQGFDYEVTYDVMGGQINQMKERVVYYKEDSPLFEPSGTSGMLVAPKNGKKTLIGWYTKYTSEETANGTVYHFDDADQWNFETDKLTADVTTDKKLTLYARWAMNPSIEFVDALGDIDTPLLKWNINIGKTLSRPTSTEPTKSGYTLIDYYSDPECTTKYVFGETITEDTIDYDSLGNAYIKIYCKFIEGEFTRVKSASQLQTIKDNPEGHYILACDIDLAGQEWTPVEGFAGVLNGNGYAITNLKMTVKNKAAGLAAKTAKEGSFGLFATLEGAEVYDLTMKGATITIDSATNVKSCIGTLAGRSKRSKITNCVFDNVTIEGNGNLKVDLTIAPVAAVESAASIQGCTVNVNTSNIKTTGTLNVLSNN